MKPGYLIAALLLFVQCRKETTPPTEEQQFAILQKGFELQAITRTDESANTLFIKKWPAAYQSALDFRKVVHFVKAKQEVIHMVSFRDNPRRVAGMYRSAIVLSDRATENIDNLEVNWFCQRKKGEAFKACFSRMEEIICDDFWGCVAYNTSPYVPVLTAFMCNCYE